MHWQAKLGLTNLNGRSGFRCCENTPGSETVKQAAKTKLETILAAHDREFLINKGQFDGQAATVETFDEAFDHVCVDVIRPAMEDVQALLQQHEVHTKIVMEKRRPGGAQDARPARAVFELHVLTDAEDHGFPITIPHIAFIAEPSTGKVRLYENAILPYLGGHSGLVREVALGDVTGDLVEESLVGLAEKVLKGGLAA